MIKVLSEAASHFPSPPQIRSPLRLPGVSVEDSQVQC